jgi:hypothetical protein
MIYKDSNDDSIHKVRLELKMNKEREILFRGKLKSGGLSQETNKGVVGNL